MNELPAELFDIVEPAHAAVQNSHEFLLIGIAIALLISVLAITRWWLQNKDRLRTLRHLRDLRCDFTAGRVTARVLAYAIAAELKSCMQTHRLHANLVLVRKDMQRDAWRNFIERLDSLRYQPGQELDAAQADAILREAVGWARQSR